MLKGINKKMYYAERAGRLCNFMQVDCRLLGRRYKTANMSMKRLWITHANPETGSEYQTTETYADACNEFYDKVWNRTRIKIELRYDDHESKISMGYPIVSNFFGCDDNTGTLGLGCFRVRSEHNGKLATFDVKTQSNSPKKFLQRQASAIWENLLIRISAIMRQVFGTITL